MENLGAFQSIDISASALSAERVRMNTIANNMANVNTTRTPSGKPFQRQEVLFESVLQDEMDGTSSGAGVKVAAISDDASQPVMVYRPDHPDADANGYVAFPNVNPVQEMVDLISAQRSYEANITSIQTTKDMVNSALGLARG